MRSTGLVALAAAVSSVSATFQGFNYGSTKSDGTFNFQADFESLFTTAQNLVGTTGFSSARLYTMIQGGSSTNEPTQAIPAAIKTKTSLLLGLWASGGSGPFAAEITALQSAITQYGSDFTNLVAGISVGSEDLYRNSALGQAANAGIGADAATISGYISQLKTALKGTALSGAKIGHVDTWTAWVDGSNTAAITAADWIGVDAYPYFQNTMSNDISSGKSLFESALAQTQSAVGSKEVWITETGWPVSGKTENLGSPSLANAKTYWDEVGCPRFGNVNIWWYTLDDSQGSTPNPSFGLSTGSTTPLYDLSCSNITAASSSSASASATGSASATAASSLSTAIVSSGSAISPTQGSSGPSGANATVTGATKPSATGSSGNLSTATGSSPSSAKSSSTTVGASGASAMSASLIAGLGALFVAFLAL